MRAILGGWLVEFSEAVIALGKEIKAPIALEGHLAKMGGTLHMTLYPVTDLLGKPYAMTERWIVFGEQLGFAAMTAFEVDPIVGHETALCLEL
jgi:hypothetical protein